jgi:hypothetical protein
MLKTYMITIHPVISTLYYSLIKIDSLNGIYCSSVKTLLSDCWLIPLLCYQFEIRDKKNLKKCSAKAMGFKCTFVLFAIYMALH